MAKKRGPGRPKGSSNKKKDDKPARLGKGFWAQVGAMLMIVFSILVFIGLFNWGGNLPVALASAIRWLLGWTAWLVPIIFVWQAVAIFRAEDNKVPTAMWVATVFFLIFFSGLFQLGLNDPTLHKAADGGGAIGWVLDAGMLNLLTATPLAFVYAVLILLLAMFVLAIPPKVVFDKIASFFHRDEAADKNNREVVSKIAREKEPEFKVNTVDGQPPARSKPAKTEKSAPIKDEKVPIVIKDMNWKLPDIKLLADQQSQPDAGDTKGNAEIIKDTLAEFKIDVFPEGANIGPRVTQFLLKPAPGVKMNRIKNMDDNIAYNLAAEHIRIEAPIPGQRAVGVEVPNIAAAIVSLRGILKSSVWTESKSPLAFGVGRDISGRPIVLDLAKLPHLLIAGQTGSGKSVMMNSLIVSMLYRATPNQLKLIMIDPKGNELGQYDDIAHLAAPIIKGTSDEEVHKAIKALHWTIGEMEQRYKKFGNIKNVKAWNEKNPDDTLPYIVVIIDELYDLIMSSKQAERDIMSSIQRIAQKGRASGIHIVVATQRPSVNVIPGTIKANITAALAFAVKSQVDSRVIIDEGGAEKLLGNGDMLVKTTEMRNLKRVQGAFIGDDEVDAVVAHIKLQSPPDYNGDLLSSLDKPDGAGATGGVDDGTGDPEYRQAVQIAVQERKMSTSLLQRKMRIGYGKASRLMDIMEERGIIGSQDGARPREVLISSLDELSDRHDEAE
ncbi:MAG: DNA translocase FtsK [Candidatus Nomurabacteria bacterium]|jgi:S-DNA-T family DNA segregation ATPase FtsK/SpoIIIE|nr:DNA translocase FtsK [Candidatus Nomurabacteria bacterium]